MSWMLALLVPCALLFPRLALADSSINCSGGIVSVGDSKLDLIAKCGEPALRDEREQLRGSVTPEAKLVVEQWTYNFGTSQFMRLVTLEQGKVVRIDRGKHGYDPAALSQAKRAERARCEPGTIKSGDLKIDLLARCGEPRLKDVSEEKRAVRGSSSAWVTVQVETWTYDHGPQRFIELVTLENGKVVRTERGKHGFTKDP